MSIFKPAIKSGLKIKIALIGPSGSGKTYSSLRVATGIGGKIGLIDTENGRGKYYADEFDYQYLQLGAPYRPERYIKCIDGAVEDGVETLIIDSASHEWSGIGGLLDDHANMSGNSYTNWSKITPRHNAFLLAIVNSPLNIIVNLRGKDEYVLSEKNGKQVPQKVGVGAVMRDGFEYEMTCSFLISQDNHVAEPMKDNTHIFSSSEVLTENHGKLLKNWAEGIVENETL